MVFSCFVAMLQDPDTAWRVDLLGSCKQGLTRASRRERYSGEGSTSHPVR